MKEKDYEENEVNNNLEDTGRLLTAGRDKVSRKRFLLIILAVVLIAAVSIIGINTIRNERYDEQVAIAEKAYTEGDYQSAEIGYLTAVSMNKRKPEAREGLAYVYAVEEKFEDSYTVYTELYADTSEEKYQEAAEEVKEGRLPSDISLVPGGIEPDENGPNLSPVYEAYAEKLEEEKEKIRGYSWQKDANGDYPNGIEETTKGTQPRAELKNKCIVIKDLNGDGIPELMYFSGEDEHFSKLNIYTCKDEKVVECKYDPVRSRGEYEPSPDRSFFTDSNYGIGVEYIVYTGKAPGTFHIAYIEGDVNIYYITTKFSMDADGYIRTIKSVIYDTGPRGVSGEIMDKYYIDGEETSPEAASLELAEDADDFNELLMLSISGYHDMEAFKNKNQPQTAMNYNEAMEWLQSQI